MEAHATTYMAHGCGGIDSHVIPHKTTHTCTHDLFRSNFAAYCRQVKGELRLEGVSFFYPSRLESPVLTQLSLTIGAGQTTALVGGSGSGKSTVIRLLQAPTSRPACRAAPFSSTLHAARCSLTPLHASGPFHVPAIQISARWCVCAATVVRCCVCCTSQYDDLSHVCSVFMTRVHPSHMSMWAKLSRLWPAR